LNVAILQASRADAGILAPLIKALKADSRFTVSIIHGADQVRKPGWLIVLGDTLETLDAARNAVSGLIPLAHIHGGDLTGNLDNKWRWAITALADLHFPCTQASAERLIKSGIEAWRVRVVGNLGIYAQSKAALKSKAAICRKLGLNPKREVVILIQHPESLHPELAGEQIAKTLELVRGYQVVAIYPNGEPGSDAIIEALKACQWVNAFANLPYLDFQALLACADMVVGNSSCGLYEAPRYGVANLCIGSRQLHREEYHDEAIDGVKVIMDTLAATMIDDILLTKRVAL